MINWFAWEAAGNTNTEDGMQTITPSLLDEKRLPGIADIQEVCQDIQRDVHRRQSLVADRVREHVLSAIQDQQKAEVEEACPIGPR